MYTVSPYLLLIKLACYSDATVCELTNNNAKNRPQINLQTF